MTHNQFQRKDAPLSKSFYVEFFSSVFEDRLRKFKISLLNNRFTSPWVTTNFICKIIHFREDVRGGVSMEQKPFQDNHNNLKLNLSFLISYQNFKRQPASLQSMQHYQQQHCGMTMQIQQPLKVRQYVHDIKNSIMSSWIIQFCQTRTPCRREATQWRRKWNILCSSSQPVGDI